MDGVPTEPARIIVSECETEIASALARDGHDPPLDVITVSSVESGLANVETGGIECVVSGAELPDGNGIELLHSVRDIDEDVPLVFLADGETPDWPIDDGFAEIPRFVPPPHDPDTVVAAILRLVRDRRERDALERDRSMLECMLSDLPLRVFFEDTEGRYVKGSDMFESMSEAEPGERLVEPGGDTYQEDMRVIESGDPILQEVRGEIELSKVPWRNDQDEVLGIAALMRDVSDRKRYERIVERQNSRFETLTEMATTGLRKPLVTARGQLAFVQGSVESDYLDTLEQTLDRMGNASENIHALAQMAQSIERTTPVSLQKIAGEVWREMETRNARLIVDDAFDSVFLEAHEHRLEQCLTHLFANAIEYGGGEVTVNIGRLDDDSGFYVEDDGPGLVSEEHHRIFEPGYTTNTNRSGLGLTIVEVIAETHGWDVSAQEGGHGGVRIEFTGVEQVDSEDDSQAQTQEVYLTRTATFGSQASGDVAMSEIDGVTVEGGGDNIWQRTNEFHYVYTSAEDGFDLQARLSEFAPAGNDPKAGLMVRSGLSEHAQQAFIGLHANLGTEFVWSDGSVDPTRSEQLEADQTWPHWYRLVREGDEVTGYSSSDGETWKRLAHRTMDFARDVYVGLAVSGENNGERTAATFDHLAGLKTWEHADVGNPELNGTARQTTRHSYTLTGSGEAEWDTVDGGEFAYARVLGDVEIVANVDLDAKDGLAGVMLRESLDADATQASLVCTSDDVQFRWRSETGSHVERQRKGWTADSGWIKLKREDDLLIGQNSPTGRENTWETVATREIPMGNETYIGLIIANEGNERPLDVEFRDVRITEQI